MRQKAGNSISAGIYHGSYAPGQAKRDGWMKQNPRTGDEDDVDMPMPYSRRRRQARFPGVQNFDLASTPLVP
jgi:hypothetical protein